MKPHKQKSPGLVVNKAAEIRRVASLLVTEGELPRPKTIRQRLGRKGIVVTSQQVSMALANTEFAYRRIQVDLRRPPVVFHDTLDAISQVCAEEFPKVKEFAREMGSIDRAIASLVALRCLKQTPAEQTEDHHAGA